MSRESRIERFRLRGSIISWPALRRAYEPISGEVVIKSPGLGLFTSRFSLARRSAILDLGSPREQNIDYFSQFPCVLHIADFLRALRDDPEMSAPEEERDVRKAVERLISYEDRTRFDGVLGWNLFDYLDEMTVRALMQRVGRYCHSGTLLYIMTANRESIPDDPGRVVIVDEQHLRFERTGMGMRDCVAYLPGNFERIMPGFRLQHSHMLGNGMQDYLFRHE